MIDMIMEKKKASEQIPESYCDRIYMLQDCLHSSVLLLSGNGDVLLGYRENPPEGHSEGMV